MQAIEFEATTFQHTIRVPDSVPDGVSVRIVLSFDDATTKSNRDDNSHKSLLASMPKVGSDEDFARSNQPKFSPLPSKLKYSRDELNERRPDYLTMTVNDIEMPARDERYDR